MKVSPISIIRNDNKELITVDFGNGSRAQHNQGISEFNEAFGLTPDLKGLDKYTIQLCPKNLSYESLDYKKEKYCVLHLDTYGIMTSSGRRKHLPYWFVDMFKFKYSDKCRFGINSAWNEHEFVIIAHEKYKDDIDALYNAFNAKDILLGYTPMYSYSDEILKFSIKSKVEALTGNDSFDIDESGRYTFQHIQRLIYAEDLAYEL